MIFLLFMLAHAPVLPKSVCVARCTPLIAEACIAPSRKCRRALKHLVRHCRHDVNVCTTTTTTTTTTTSTGCDFNHCNYTPTTTLCVAVPGAACTTTTSSTLPGSPSGALIEQEDAP
jgi:hypothetical protein